MAEYIATMPQLPLTSDMAVKFEAVDPTTGLAVSGVTVSRAVIYAVDLRAEGFSLESSGPFMLVEGPGSIAGGG